jgi:hypothetical protein
MTDNDIVLLVEKRGVGIFPFRKEIKEIVDYTQDLLYTENVVLPIKKFNTGKGIKNVTLYNVRLPKELTKKITWIQNLIIDINIINFIDSEDSITNLTGFGSSSGGLKLIQSEKEYKLSDSYIKVTCYAYQKSIYPRTLYLTLYHEFNHQFDAFNRLVGIENNHNSETLEMSINKLNYDTIISGAENMNDYNMFCFCRILYRLFIPTEFNALVASVYGDLKGMNSKHFEKDYKKLKAYEVYSDIKDNYLPVVEKASFDDWVNFASLNIQRINNIEAFKNRFIRETEYKLNDLFHRIGKTASLYYEKEMKGNFSLTEGIVTDDNVSLVEPLKESFDSILNEIDKDNNTKKRITELMFHKL